MIFSALRRYAIFDCDPGDFGAIYLFSTGLQAVSGALVIRTH